VLQETQRDAGPLTFKLALGTKNLGYATDEIVMASIWSEQETLKTRAFLTRVYRIKERGEIKRKKKLQRSKPEESGVDQPFNRNLTQTGS